MHLSNFSTNIYLFKWTNKIHRLQDEYVQVQSEMKATIEETKLVQEKYKTLLDQAKKDQQAKQAECDALREQVCPVEIYM